MRILVVGAGAVGGYIAARMIEDGLDVTLLVREARKAQLLSGGLVVRSPKGDYAGQPQLIVAGDESNPFDLVVIACKAYGLQGVLAQIKPYIHARTALLPFLNGYKHMLDIAAAYPGQPLLGGVAKIESTLDANGAIVHMSPYYSFVYGPFADLQGELYGQIHQTLSAARVLTESPDIRRSLWEKYSFISGLSGLTTLFQAPVGDIRDAGEGIEWFRRIFDEIARIIRAAGGTIPENMAELNLKAVEGMSAGSTSSMLRDLLSGQPTEGSHIHGYLLELAREHRISAPLLEVVYQRLAVYENKRG
ncbi:ketopantoate reductase family protein [Cohnella panacarvi]|uniref:ketopantoate reductase family protein n=1 Tax=Cohnella panacarvi TaxID=400776 RepID=UPI00047A84F1|nr:ketopantoate reductase family protein [Cohnella panacarvi]